MIQENELVMLVLGVCVLAFVIKNNRRFKSVKGWKFLSSAFYNLLAGWVLTVIEGFLLGDVLNYLEHICYAVSSILLALWCWQNCMSKEVED